MFERFTEKARQVVMLAEKDAQIHSSETVGPEHILRGLIQEEEGLAAGVLRRYHIDTQIDHLKIPHGESEESPSFSSEGKKCLELALREALSLGHNFIGTEHVLLGLVREPGAHVDEFLRGVLDDYYRMTIRDEVIRILIGPRPVATKQESEEPEHSSAARLRKLEDLLNDLVTGFELWKSSKVPTWTNEDEAFARWVEASDLSDFR